VLVVSTDPAHSLADALAAPLASRPRLVRRRLTGLELDAPRAFARWLGEHRSALGDVIEHGTWLDRADVASLLGLSIPGVDELAGVLELARLALDQSRYDEIVVDTAPTGHALRLLSAPETVGAVADVMDDLQRDHRLIRQQLARVGRPEAADRLIELLATQARDIGALLRDRATTTLNWVMLPETLSLAETGDALRTLERAGLGVRRLVVNRVLPPGPPCGLCDRRRVEERRVLRQARRTLGRSHRIILVESAVREPRGISALRAIGAQLTARSATLGSTGRGVPPRRATSPRASRATADAPVPGAGGMRQALDALGARQLIVFGGKGGVGKTTTAAAVALALARGAPGSRVLLLSTDPAPSLGDVFDTPLGDRPSAVPHGPPNLLVRELDAPAILGRWREALEHAVGELETVVRSASIASGRGVHNLMQLAPPGIDELLGLVTVAEALSGRARPGGFDRVVVDAAPTGHTLRLLEVPDRAREWLQVLMRMLLKYRDVIPPGKLGAELLELSRGVRALQELMRDPRRSGFAVVTRADEVPRLETMRLLAGLRRLRLDVPLVIVNALTPQPDRCPRCRAVAASERRELARLRKAAGIRSAAAGSAAEPRRRNGCVIIHTPLVAPPPRGARSLEAWSTMWNV
jgi:arsenite-transporting ATPase